MRLDARLLLESVEQRLHQHRLAVRIDVDVIRGGGRRASRGERKSAGENREHSGHRLGFPGNHAIDNHSQTIEGQSAAQG